MAKARSTFQGNDGQWFFITGDGELYLQNAQDFSASTLVATLDARFHLDPTLLTEASVATTADAQLVGQHFGLYASDRVTQANFYEDFRGQGEKYLQGNNGRWYFLTSDGGLYEQNAQDFTASHLVAHVGASGDYSHVFELLT